MKAHLGFICVSFFFLTLFLVGLYNILTNYEPNRCNMTYMYEYPQLVRISLPSDISRTYIKYGLYAYGEGRSIHRVREMKFSGIPVLFIPGNRGSPMQVRSLASVSLTKAVRSRIPFSFDYFAVDLNEDFSGLYGGFLKEQTSFVNICIKRVLSLYRKEIRATKPTTIILIAHSMGGMIAKGLFLEPDFDPSVVQMIVTLATPHSPALLSDHLLSSYYESVNAFWDTYNASEDNINVISIGGGPRDLLVRSDLTLTPHADISVIASAIPAVWLSVDHLCIVWCKELVLSIVRILFDSIDIKSRQVIEDVNRRKEIFSYHLLNRTAGKSYHTSVFEQDVDLTTEGNSGNSWIEMNTTSFSWSKPEGTRNSATYISVSLATPSDGLVLEGINHETKDWIFACTLQTTYSGVKKCKTAINLSSEGRVSPTVDLKRKTAILNLSHLRRDRYTHVIVKTLPTREFTQINFDLFRKRDRVLVGSSYYLLSNVVVPQTEIGSLFYSIELPDVYKFWHNYVVRVTPLTCSVPIHAIASVRVPWSNEGATSFLRKTSSSIGISLLTPKPAKSSSNVAVDIFLNKNCSYNISVERSLILTLSSVVLRFGAVLIAHITVCLLLTLAYQVKSLGENGSCPLIQFVMPITAKPYFIIQASALTGTITQGLATMFTFLPETDIKNQSSFIEVVLIPVFLHLTAFAITYLFASAVLVGVIVQGQAFNGILLRFINKFFFGLTWLSEYVMNGVSKVPIVVSAFMITVSSSACGGLALSIGLFFYFFKLISLYEDFWEEIVYWPLRVLKWKLKQRRTQAPNEMPRFQIPPIKDISFHLTLMLLWSIAALVNIPSVLVWAKNYKYSTHLNPDPTFINAVIMSACAGILWQAELPKTGLIWSKQIGYIIVGSSIFVMVYAQTSLYRLSYILSGVFVLVTVHQLVGGFFTPDDEPVQLVPIVDDEPSTQEIEEETNTETESSPMELELNQSLKEQQDASDEESNEFEEEKNKIGNEKDSPSEGSSTSSFEHISEQEQL